MENVVKKLHSVTLEGRSKAVMSGIEKVISATETIIDLATVDGALVLQGKGLKINRFNVDDGSLALEGEIEQLRYRAAKTPVLKRIFK